jgi:hypothetical protein
VNVVISQHALERALVRHPGSRKTAKQRIVRGVREALVDVDRVVFGGNTILAHRDGRRFAVTFGEGSVLVLSVYR